MTLNKYLHTTRLLAVSTLVLTMSHGLVAAQTLSQRLKSEAVESLAAAARAQGNAVEGAILFTQQNLNCTLCHNSSAIKPVGPDLTQLQDDVSDTYLVEALLLPSKFIRKGFKSVSVVTTAGKVHTGRITAETPDSITLLATGEELKHVTVSRSDIEEIAPHKISAMPDNLVDQLSNRDQFLHLVRYMMELADNRGNRNRMQRMIGGGAIRPELEGLVLLKEFNCSACHSDDINPLQLNGKQGSDLQQTLRQFNSSYLQRFLTAPHQVHPGTTMPDMMAAMQEDERDAAVRELTHYLMSLRGQDESGDGITEQTVDVEPLNTESVSRGRDLFHTVGCVACHSPRDQDGHELLPKDSVPLKHVNDKFALDSLVAYLKDPLKFAPSGRMPKMQLTHWEASDLAGSLLSDSQQPAATPSFELDSVLADRGKLQFNTLGCRQCHQLGPDASEPLSMPLSAVRPSRGCLSGKIGTWPLFDLSPPQRVAIQAALRLESPELSPQDQIAATLTAFRCLNCHQRDELGGIAADRDGYFKTENQNLGPQGRIPPTLTSVGAKLKPLWMRQVLVSGRTIRPYVQTRMPQFGTDNVAHLVDLFQEADDLPEMEFAEFQDEKEMRTVGAEMVGTGGLNCIVCHTFQLKKAANMPAVDLTDMAERLQKNWFYHYMRDPQSLSQNTIMPSFWPGGKAMRRDILGGDRDLQIEALWQYLLDGRQARTPRGLIREPMELLATDEAVMLRRSYPDIGKRGIGVGYPHQVNLGFDAEQMRLAMIWKGKFADPAGVWRSQGHGRVRLLGDRLIKFAVGPELDDARNPWIVDDGRPPRHQFKGYSLDAKMRPRFRYRFADVMVEDYAVDLLDPSTGVPFLRRTITLQSSEQDHQLEFRVASGKSVRQNEDGSVVVDEQLTIRMDPPHRGMLSESPEGQQLRIPLSLSDGREQLTLEYRW